MEHKLFSITKKDFDIQSFRCGGAGGQHRDKTSNGIRIVHKLSGASGQATDSRSKATNIKTAFKRLVETKIFQTWLKLEIAKYNGVLDEIEKIATEYAEREINNPQNLKIEYIDN